MTIQFGAELRRALQARESFIDERHESAFRLFNGFLEGMPELAVDLYGSTLVLHNYAEDASTAHIQPALDFYLENLPWVQAAILKTRTAAQAQDRRGSIIYGQSPNRRVREAGVWYAVDLTLNLDASLYLDTRGLREWAQENLQGRRVLNTFAYTGSLGVAAVAGGARQVIQLDLNRRFLNLAKDSYALNGFPVRRADFLSGDFWALASQLIRAGELFDCVFVDPPFFSSTSRGTVDLVAESHRVINKARPLVGHGGWLVAINNALFLSGADYRDMLQALCADGYLSLEALIPVPPDFTGFPETRVGQLPVDPTPFNHSTKIAVLRASRKDQKRA
jgi:23S rRNA (cytosine1962-C5)-methyltransferase